MNKETAGRTKCFIVKPTAGNKSYLTSEYRIDYLRELRNVLGQRDSQANPPGLQLPRIRRDEAAAQSLADLMEMSWLNPIRSDQDDFVSLSTVTVALLVTLLMHTR